MSRQGLTRSRQGLFRNRQGYVSGNMRYIDFIENGSGTGFVVSNDIRDLNVYGDYVYYFTDSVNHKPEGDASSSVNFRQGVVKAPKDNTTEPIVADLTFTASEPVSPFAEYDWRIYMSPGGIWQDTFIAVDDDYVYVASAWERYDPPSPPPPAFHYAVAFFNVDDLSFHTATFLGVDDSLGWRHGFRAVSKDTATTFIWMDLEGDIYRFNTGLTTQIDRIPSDETLDGSFQGFDVYKGVVYAMHYHDPGDGGRVTVKKWAVGNLDTTPDEWDAVYTGIPTEARTSRCLDISVNGLGVFFHQRRNYPDEANFVTWYTHDGEFIASYGDDTGTAENSFLDQFDTPPFFTLRRGSAADEEYLYHITKEHATFVTRWG